MTDLVWDAGSRQSGPRSLRCHCRLPLGRGQLTLSDCGGGELWMDYGVRRARTSDVRAIRDLLDANVTSGRLLDKPTVTLYEDIQEFRVATTPDGEIAGCGALH